MIGIDLAAKPTNPFGWALLEGSRVSVRQLLTDEEIVAETIRHAPALVAVDAPLGLPQDRQEHMRKADREMHRKGYPVLPPRFRSMRNLTLRAANIAFQLESSGLAIIEVHPASTRKALNIPRKDWKYIQKTLLRIGSKGDIRNRFLTPHEIDAVTAALTGYLHRERKTELIGDIREGYIVVPKKTDWRRLTL